MSRNRFHGLPGSGRQKGSFLSQQAQHSMVKNIVDQREDAAQTALKIIFGVLNRDFGFGYERLYKLGIAANKEISEYYADREYKEVKLNEYLARIGFLIVDGHIYSTTNKDGKLVRGETAKDAIEAQLKKDGGKVPAEILARGR